LKTRHATRWRIIPRDPHAHLREVRCTIAAPLFETYWLSLDAAVDDATHAPRGLAPRRDA